MNGWWNSVLIRWKLPTLICLFIQTSWNKRAHDCWFTNTLTCSFFPLSKCTKSRRWCNQQRSKMQSETSTYKQYFYASTHEVTRIAFILKLFMKNPLTAFSNLFWQAICFQHLIWFYVPDPEMQFYVLAKTSRKVKDVQPKARNKVEFIDRFVLIVENSVRLTSL